MDLYAYLMYLMIASFLLTGVSFARYVSTGSGSDGARVAAGSVVVFHDPAATTIELSRSHDDEPVTENFEFSISNQNSEVAIRYDVVVSLAEALPEGVSMSLDGIPCSGNSGKEFVFPDAGVFSAGFSDIRYHMLSFTGDYNVIQEQSTRVITISVQSEQIN